MFFGSFSDLARILIVGLCAYVGLIVLLRVSGKRTLSKMNAFDFVVTVALGSTLATILLSKDVALVDGLVALALLIFLQYAVAWSAVRWPVADRLVKSQPILLFYRGSFQRGAMRAERVTEGEVRAAIREQGIASLEEVEAVVLETAGTLSALRRNASQRPTALAEMEVSVDEATVTSKAPS